jgi:hypothetical protein
VSLKPDIVVELIFDRGWNLAVYMDHIGNSLEALESSIVWCQVEADEVAQKAGVNKLVPVHVVPPVENSISKRMYLAKTADAFDGDIVLGQDRAGFELDPK